MVTQQEQIEQHEVWFVQYQKLLERKRSAIRMWRLEKRVDVITATESAERVDEHEMERRKRDLEKKREEKEEARRALEQWKERKRLEAEAKAAAEEKAAEIRRIEEDRRRKEHV
jgi:hypothetical protein